MNSTILDSKSQSFLNQNIMILDEEKNRIMEKVYSSNVFREFILQWGNAMAEDEYEK